MSFLVPGPFRGAAIRLVDVLRKTDALDLLPGLLESQWWDRGRLEALQRERLAELGRFCRDEVPYYGDLFEASGLGDGDELTPESLTALPLTDKDVIRAQGARLRARSFDRWQPRAKSTSGSTGAPLNYYLDRPSHSMQWAHLWRGWDQAGYAPGDVYATLSGGSLLPEKVGLKQAVYLALSGALHLPSYHLTEPVMDDYLARLAGRSVAFLYGYPSSLEIFAEHVLERGGAAVAMKAVFTTSETLAPRARATIARAFDCPVIDTYGCNDGGLYTFECGRADGYHVGMESVFVEILDEAGRRVPDGEVGRIVTTNLSIRAMPLLRYVTGDLGALSREPCACGRGLVRVVELQGRDRDVVFTPAGRKVHGAFFNHFEPFYAADWLVRYQVYQPDVGSLVVRVKVSREPTAEERGHIVGELRRGLGDMDVSLETVEEFETTRTGKFRVVVSDVV